MKSSSDRLVPWTPVAIALTLIVSMMSRTEEWLYLAAAVGAAASVAVGRTLGPSDATALAARVKKFTKGWTGAEIQFNPVGSAKLLGSG